MDIIEEKDFKKLIDIQVEHMNYYPFSPIFISKNNEIQNARTDLEKHFKNGDAFLVYCERSQPAAYFIVGDATTGDGGSLLKETGTAQIKSAYVKSPLRGKGIGTALLQRALDWSKEQGYERLLVEHETANYYGGHFWRKYFRPYLYTSLRYIDNTIDYR